MNPMIDLKRIGEEKVIEILDTKASSILITTSFTGSSPNSFI